MVKVISVISSTSQIIDMTANDTMTYVDVYFTLDVQLLGVVPRTNDDEHARQLTTEFDGSPLNLTNTFISDINKAASSGNLTRALLEASSNTTGVNITAAPNATAESQVSYETTVVEYTRPPTQTPTGFPTVLPTAIPTANPTTSRPTAIPTTPGPTASPVLAPTKAASNLPASNLPTIMPSKSPSIGSNSDGNDDRHDVNASASASVLGGSIGASVFFLLVVCAVFVSRRKLIHKYLTSNSDSVSLTRNDSERKNERQVQKRFSFIASGSNTTDSTNVINSLRSPSGLLINKLNSKMTWDARRLYLSRDSSILSM